MRWGGVRFAAVMVCAASVAGRARAEGPPARGGEAAKPSEPESDLQTADGADACHAFQAKNDKELDLWEKTQPPQPYRYPREKLFLHAPWAKLFGKDMGFTGELLLATLLPHVGAQVRGDAPAAHISWPWSVLVFGPMYACSRKQNTFVVHGHRVHRLLVEPAVLAAKRGVGVSVRPGYRFVWHPSSWVVGPGLGIGSTVEIRAPGEPFRFSASAEALLHFGHCCTSSYFVFALRFDRFFRGENRNVFGGSLGYTFF